MTTLQQIKEELKKVNEARDKATPGEWVVQQKSLSNFDHPYVFDRTYGGIFDPIASSTKMINRPNCDFICLAANRIAQLTKAIEVMADALISIKRYETMTNYPQHEINHALLVEAPYEASEALEKVVEILKG